jgi:hypothetical protein
MAEVAIGYAIIFVVLSFIATTFCLGVIIGHSRTKTKTKTEAKDCVIEDIKDRHILEQKIIDHMKKDERHYG